MRRADLTVLRGWAEVAWKWLRAADCRQAVRNVPKRMLTSKGFNQISGLLKLEAVMTADQSGRWSDPEASCSDHISYKFLKYRELRTWT